MQKYGIKSPSSGGELSPPTAYNLMFQTSMGLGGKLPTYLRPETAQGQFLNFQKLWEFNQRSMPFASASVGRCFRNEISPRSGLRRVREFTLAEIAHFSDPASDQKHPGLEAVRDVEMNVLARAAQVQGRTETERMTIGHLVQTGLVQNETLAYFLGRVQLFLAKLGVDASKVRFRQHMAREMAHYASDCWDAELLTSYGWVECVGCADRSAFDLRAHAQKTGQALVVRETRKEALHVEEWHVAVERSIFGPRFKRDGKAIQEALDALSQSQLERFASELVDRGSMTIEVAGMATSSVELDDSLVSIVKRTRVERVREYTPNVIEPSFGIGRILYGLIEHVYWTREEDEERRVSTGVSHLSSDS